MTINYVMNEVHLFSKPRARNLYAVIIPIQG